MVWRYIARYPSLVGLNILARYDSRALDCRTFNCVVRGRRIYNSSCSRVDHAQTLESDRFGNAYY
jgi:hypothetical protein